MLKYWKRFWRARRQKDSVKMALLLAAAAIGFLAGAAYRGVALYRTVNQPTEYVLSGGSASNLTDMPYLVAVSTQWESQRTLIYQGRELPVSCIALSEEYLKKVYGIEIRGSTETFYANQAAFRQMDVTEKEFFVTYRSEKGEKTEFLATVKILLAEGIPDQENPLIFVADSRQGVAGVQQDMAGTQQGMAGVQQQQKAVMDGVDAAQSAVSGTAGGQQAGDGIRVCFQRQDLEGSQRKQLERNGFTVENREQLLEVDCRKGELLLRIGYEAMIGFLLAVGAFYCGRITANHSRYRRMK